MSLNQDFITLSLLAIFLLSGIGVILIGGWIYRKESLSREQERLSRYVNPSLDDRQVTPGRTSLRLSNRYIEKFRNWINDSLRILSSEKLQLKLSAAYWAITDIEYILIRIVVAVVAFLLGWLLPGNILGGIMLAVIAIMTPPILLEKAITKRQQKFHHQLLNFLTIIKGAVQAGYSLMQALDLAVKEIPAPTSEEFGRVLHEVRLGITLEAALTNLAERMESDDLQIVVTAVIINSQVGGNLSTMLEATISTIRDRIQLMGEIRSISSYARYLGNLMTLLPFIMGFGIFIISPNYFDTVKTSLITQIIFLMALLGVIIGNFWIRRLVRIRV